MAVCGAGFIPVYIVGDPGVTPGNELVGDRRFAGCYSPDESWIQPFLDNTGKFATLPADDPVVRNLFDPEEEEVLNAWNELLARYEAGEATLQDLKDFDDSALSNVDWWSDYYDNIISTESEPDLSELIEQYGEDVVNDLKGKYDELVDFIGNIPEDPLGSLKKMAEIFIEGATGISPDCTASGGPAGTALPDWIRNCVTVGILVDIGIPGLPGGLGSIFKGATIGEIEEGLKNIGKKFEDIINGTPTCGEKNDQECTPEQILEDLGNWVVDSVRDIFADEEDEITIESILGKLGGIFGSVLGGIIYGKFKDLINGEIEDVIGIPVLPFDTLQECEDKGLVTIEDPEGSGNFKCGTECKQQGFTPTGPQGECIDPNAVEDYDCSEAGREQVAGARSAADCGPCTEETEDGTQFEPNPTTGFCEDPTVDDTALTEQEKLCKDTGRKYDDLNDICLEECENAQYVIKADGDCGPPDEDGTDCPEGQVRRGGLDDGYCVKPGQSCQSEPTKYAGDDQNINVGQFNSEGFCVALDDGPPDDTGGQCPADSERDGQNPIYDGRDTNQSGFFTSNGITYTYEPCNPSLGYSIVGQNVNVCEDKNNQNYGNIVQQPEEPCGDCNQGFHKEGKKCVPDGDNGGEKCPNGDSPATHIDNDCEQPCRRGLVDFGNGCQSLDNACEAPQTEDQFKQCESFGWFQCDKFSDFPNKWVKNQQDCIDTEQVNPEEGDECKITQPDGTVLTGKYKDVDGTMQCLPDLSAPPPPVEPPPPVTCQDPNRNKNEDKSCADTCTDGSPAPESGLCPPPIEQCVTPDGTPTGATLESGCEVCPTGQDFNTDGICVDTVLPEVCNDPNAVNDGQDGPCECKPGFSKDPETLLCVQGTPSCDNGATEESGCDTCPDGTSVLEYEDGMCPSEPPKECANGATDYPDCTVCPEGQSMDAEGNCTDCSDCSCAEYAAANPEECITEPPETGGGGSVGGGGGGSMFDPFMAGISYTKQAVPEPPAPPQKDYMAELDNLIKRSLFEGMA